MDCDVLDLNDYENKDKGKGKEKMVVMEENEEEVGSDEGWEDWRQFELDDRVGESSQSRRRM
jgi:hypothetical protein